MSCCCRHRGLYDAAKSRQERNLAYASMAWILADRFLWGIDLIFNGCARGAALALDAL
jgi:hypothetical protein